MLESSGGCKKCYAFENPSNHNLLPFFLLSYIKNFRRFQVPAWVYLRSTGYRAFGLCFVPRTRRYSLIVLPKRTDCAREWRAWSGEGNHRQRL